MFSNTTDNGCGTGSYRNDTECIPIPSPLHCDGIFLYEVHNYASIELIWDPIQIIHQNDSNHELRYIINYLSQYGSQNTIITPGNSYIISDSYVNIGNYTNYIHQNIASISTTIEYNPKTNTFPTLSLSNKSTNCTFIIPSLTTTSPTPSPSPSSPSDVAYIHFNGSFCNKHNCNANKIKLHYNSIDDIDTALNKTFVSRKPVQYYNYDLLFKINYCLNATIIYDINKTLTFKDCSDYEYVYNKTENYKSLHIAVPDDIVFDKFDIFTMEIIECQAISDQDILNESIYLDDKCIISHPMMVEYKLNEITADAMDVTQLWWFWLLIAGLSLIILCILLLFGLMWNQKRMKKKIGAIKYEIKIVDKDTYATHYDRTKLLKHQPDMRENPMATGIPDSIPLQDPIQDEIEQRYNAQLHVVTDAFASPFTFKTTVKPNDKIINPKDRKKNKKNVNSQQEMTELDNKANKKGKNWKNVLKEPLLQ